MKWILTSLVLFLGVGFSVAAEPGVFKIKSDVNWNTKKWSDMSLEERKKSMDNLHLLNNLVTKITLKHGGFNDMKEYNAKFNPTLDQMMKEMKEKWSKFNSKTYKYNAWLGE